MKLLITGAAGFIGMHAAFRFLSDRCEVVGLDNINSYYDVGLKHARLKELGISSGAFRYNQMISGVNGFRFIQLDLCDAGNMMALFATEKFDAVVHLAAQAGVRFSITNPRDYIDSNITGFFNLLEAVRAFPVQHFIYASSSSVYGNSHDVPFSVSNNTNTPVSLYAATKKTNELLAYTYSHLYGIPATGLRFFTVYGPWGRPDMAYYSFAENIINGRPIKLYNNGQLKRDFTYIDDITESLSRLLPQYPDGSPPCRLLNIGRSCPEDLGTFVGILERYLGRSAQIEFLPMQPGDVYLTYSDTSDIEKLTGFKPQINLDEGLRRFVDWYVGAKNDG